MCWWRVRVVTCAYAAGRLATPGARQRRKPADESKLRKACPWSLVCSFRADTCASDAYSCRCQVTGRLFTDVPAQSLRRSSRLSGLPTGPMEVSVQTALRCVAYLTGITHARCSRRPLPGREEEAPRLVRATRASTTPCYANGAKPCSRCRLCASLTAAVRLACRNSPSAKTSEGGREALALMRQLGEGHRQLSKYRCQARLPACL